MKKFLLILPVAVSLASCDFKMPPSAISLAPVSITLDVPLESQGNVAYFHLRDRLAFPIMRSAALRGTLNPRLPDQTIPDSNLSVSGEVYASLVRPDCLGQDTKSMTCEQPEGTRVGSFNIEYGVGSLVADSAQLAEGLNAGELWLGLRLASGSLPANTTLTYRGLVLPP